MINIQICGSTTDAIVLSEGKSYILSDIHNYHESQDLLGFRQSRKYKASILKHYS